MSKARRALNFWSQFIDDEEAARLGLERLYQGYRIAQRTGRLKAAYLMRRYGAGVLRQLAKDPGREPWVGLESVPLSVRTQWSEVYRDYARTYRDLFSEELSGVRFAETAIAILRELKPSQREAILQALWGEGEVADGA